MLHYSQIELLLNYNERFKDRFNLAQSDRERYFSYIHSQSQAFIEKKLEIDFAFISELNKTLTTISEIARKPHFSVRDEDIVIRSSLISEFRNEKFQKTIRESELWRQKNGQKTPEYSYGSEYVDDYAIYENIVIKMCFHKIEMVVNTFDYYYQNYIRDLGISFSFDNYTFTSFFQTTTNKLIDQSIFDIHQEVNRILETLRLSERKIDQIKKTHFYREVSKTNDIRDKIVLTNILKVDTRYNKVFHFYTRLMRNIDHIDRKEATINYLTSIILKTVHRKFEFLNVKQVVKRNTFNLKYENRRFYLNVLRKQNTFLFKVKPLLRKSILAISSLTIVNDLEEYQKISGVNAYEYVLANGEIYRYVNNEFEHLKYNYSQGDFALIETLISSLFVTIDLGIDKLIKTCPICGNNNLGIKRKYDTTCLNCGAEHAAFNINQKDAFVWIKKVNLENNDGTRT